MQLEIGNVDIQKLLTLSGSGGTLSVIDGLLVCQTAADIDDVPGGWRFALIRVSHYCCLGSLLDRRTPVRKTRADSFDIGNW